MNHDYLYAALPENMMILHHCFKVRSLILTVALIAGLSLGTHAAAQERSFLVDLNSKTATDLGTLGGNRTVARAINDAGQVVGTSETVGDWRTRAFITGPDGIGMRDLGSLGGSYTVATGINNEGRVVGEADVGLDSHAFITGPDGRGMRDLGTPAGAVSGATGINDAGQVAGWYLFEADYPRHPSAFITGPDGTGKRDLIALGGNFTSAEGINNSGQVVGWTGTEDNLHAFITGPNGEDMRDLHRSSWIQSFANDINETGQVVGTYTTSLQDPFDPLAYTFGSFITGPDGTGMRGLGTTGGDYTYAASSINDAGQVAGSFWGADGSFHGFITGPDGMGIMDLNLLVDLPAGVTLTGAVDINNNGQVIATGIVPEPEAYALMLAGLVLVGFIARRKKAENVR
jgi:probable HAF family extracellular repeat protein